MKTYLITKIIANITICNFIVISYIKKKCKNNKIKIMFHAKEGNVT